MRIAIAMILLAACSDTATGLDGRWAIGWTRVDGSDPQPAMMSSAVVSIEDELAVWGTEPRSALAGVRDGDCLVIGDGTPMPHPEDRAWAIYDTAICDDNGAVFAEMLLIRGAGEFQTRWRMDGVRK